MHDGMEELADDEPIRRTDMVEIANEFAYVRVCKLWTRNGERLEIQAPRMEQSIRLDPLTLEALSGQASDSVMQRLVDPFGPGS